MSSTEFLGPDELADARAERDYEWARQAEEMGYGGHSPSAAPTGAGAGENRVHEGYGRKWEQVPHSSALREVFDDGDPGSGDWDQCVYHMIGGRVQRFVMEPSRSDSEGELRARIEAKARELDEAAAIWHKDWVKAAVPSERDHASSWADAYDSAAEALRSLLVPKEEA